MGHHCCPAAVQMKSHPPKRPKPRPRRRCARAGTSPPRRAGRAVNRLRYLEGTPKTATLWIDTGWTIGLWRLAPAITRGSATRSG